MKILKTYSVGELPPPSQPAIEAGAYYYAARMLLQQNNCPPHMVAKMHQTFVDEYLGGMFDLTGQTRFPSELFKEPKAPLADSIPDGGLKVIEGGPTEPPNPI